MDARRYILQFLAESTAMQLATSRDSQPWISNVHFVHDDEGNLYWLSTEDRRHSKEIVDNPQVAISIVVKSDMPVIGMQAAGWAEKVTDLGTIRRVMTNYVKKHGTGKDFYKRALVGINRHKLYRMTPEFISLFDEVHFPKSAPQVWKPSKNEASAS